MVRLRLSEIEALYLLAALESLEALEGLPEGLEGLYGRLVATGCTAPFKTALEALEAR